MESIDIVASIIAVVETISFSYRELRNIEELPRAFIEVEDHAPLIAETLHHLLQGLQSHFLDWKDDDVVVKSLYDGLTKCLELVRSIDSILCEVTAVQYSGVSTWSNIADSYLKMVGSIGKGHNIETLMLNLLNELRTLFLNDSITKDFAFPRQDEKLGNACKSLTDATSYLPASDSYKPFTTGSIFSKASTTTSVFSKASAASSAFSRYSVTRSPGETSKGGEYDSERIIQQLLKIDPAKNHNDELLSVAAQSGAEFFFRHLLHMDHIDFNRKVKDGRTPLSFAAEKGHTTVTRLLLEMDSDTESTDTAGRTPLSLAAGEGHHAVVEVLLDHGGDTESTDMKGRTPLSWAAGEGHITVVRLLLECRSNIESRDNTGWTPLLWAGRKGHEEIVSHLIWTGADVDSADDNGRTLLSWAAVKGQKEAVAKLLDAGADASSKDNTGYTPLAWAVAKGHLGVVQQLLLEEDLLEKDLKVSGRVAKEAGWLSCSEDESLTTADTQEPVSKLDVNWHQSPCAHKLRKKEGESFTNQTTDLRAHHLCRSNMQNQLSLLCGLAGVFPPGRNPSSAFGGVSFSIKEASISFSSKQNGASNSRVSYGFILQLHQAASGLVSGAICLQQSGFCCNQFTVLTVFPHESGQYVVGMKTIAFDRLLELEASIEALRQEESDSTISRCVSTCMHILENLFDISLPMPSTIGLKLHYCSLAVQLLCLGLVLYSRAHVGTFHPVYLAKPLNNIILCGSSSEHLQISAEKHELSCMGEMVGEKVFAFRLISKILSTEKKQSPAYLSATCDEIVDSWGPGSLLFADPEGLSEDRIFGLVIRGGIIEYHGRSSNGDRLFHWGEELVNTDPTSSAVFSYWDKIVIGADLGATEGSVVTVVHRMKPEAQANAPQDDHQESEESANGNILEKQSQLPSLYRSVNVNDTCKRDTLETWRASQGYRAMMGTEPSVWKFVERSFVLQFGDKVLGQVGANQIKQPGVSAKQAVLDRWTNEGNLLLLEELYGLQVSLCTGVARRVPLRVIVCDDLIDYIGGLKIPGWKELEGQARRAMMSKESFCEWDSKLTPDSESRKCMVKVVDKLLRRLRDTGFDKNGIRFVLLWPNKSEAHHCVRLAPEGDQAWCRMLKDKEWSTTFAVATNLCLEASSYKCRDGQTVWGGMKTLSTFMFYSEPGGSSTICAKTWQINHDRWYWSGETGGKVMFLARKKPEKVAELDFYRRRLNVLPKRLWSFIPSPEVLVEITSMEDSGEEVLIACRS